LDKIGLIAGFLLMVAGMYKIDLFLIPTLDYFGKYVFFGIMNIFVLWLFYTIYKKFKHLFFIPFIYGLTIFLIGFNF